MLLAYHDLNCFTPYVIITLCNNYTSHMKNNNSILSPVSDRIVERKKSSKSDQKQEPKEEWKIPFQIECKTQDQWTFHASIIYAQTLHGLGWKGSDGSKVNENKTAPLPLDATDIEAYMGGNGNMIFVVNCRRNFPFRFVSHLSLSYPDVERSEILNE